MRTDIQIKEFIESSFKPLDCVAELVDCDSKIRFRIFDASGKSLLQFEPIPTHELRSGRGLETIVDLSVNSVAPRLPRE